MKVIVIILFLAVIASLFSGLFFLYKDKGQTNRVVKSLTLRVALSMTVFLFLMVSYYFGWYPPK
jgi:Protein of unknown function (DUF2909)